MKGVNYKTNRVHSVGDWEWGGLMRDRLLVIQGHPSETDVFVDVRNSQGLVSETTWSIVGENESKASAIGLNWFLPCSGEHFIPV